MVIPGGEEMEHKTIRVEKHTHHKVKIEAAKAGMQIKEFVDNLINAYMDDKKQKEEQQ